MEFYDNKKYKEGILYIIFGGMTTLINIFLYIFLSRLFNLNLLVANAISWIFSVMFAYVSNKFWVFRNNKIDIRHLIKECFGFIGCRLLSGVIEMIMMFVMIKVLFINDIVIKVFTNIVVIIINYLLSKYIIFKN